MNINIPLWWLWSTIAWTVSGAALRLLEYWPSAWAINDERLALTMLFSALFVPPAIVQAWLLRKHISRAWMWPIAAIVSSSTFVIPLLSMSMMNEIAGIITFGVAGLMQGAVMGLSLLWLFGMANDEKVQRAYVEQQYGQSQGTYLKRLESPESDVEVENIIDDDVAAWDRTRR